MFGLVFMLKYEGGKSQYHRGKAIHWLKKGGQSVGGCWVLREEGSTPCQ